MKKLLAIVLFLVGYAVLFSLGWRLWLGVVLVGLAFAVVIDEKK